MKSPEAVNKMILMNWWMDGWKDGWMDIILVVVFWPEVSGGQDVERKDVGVDDGLISLWCVSNATLIKLGVMVMVRDISSVTRHYSKKWRTFHFSSLLTNDQLFHLFPLDIISCLMSDGDGDPPLNALCSPERTGSKPNSISWSDWPRATQSGIGRWHFSPWSLIIV